MTKKGGGLPGKKLKEVKGKSTRANSPKPSEMYKPTMWLDGKQVPKELAGAKPGDTVTMTVQAKVTRKSESLGGEHSVSVELDKMAVQPKPKK